jgi:glycosyltransferase involved in cell wall biosynthesis
MRILHLIPSLGGGGAERQLAYLTSGLHTLGCEQHVGVLAGGANLPLVEQSATVHRRPTRSNYDPRIFLRFVSLIRNVRPDVVHTWLPQMDVFGGAAAVLTGTPWVMSERSSGVHYPRTFAYIVRRAVGRHADAVVANSGLGLDSWPDDGPRRLIVRNAVPFAEIDAAPPDPRHYGTAKVILFAGRLSPEKNASTLIAALRDVLAQRDAIALLCGEGPLEQELQAEIAATGHADRIRLLGFCANVSGLMKRADVLAAPSWFEGHPNVSTEAAAAGCPLVVSDIPAHRAWLDQDAALFAPPGDARALAAAILQTLDDPAAARARAVHARELVSQWSIEPAALAYFNLYRDLRVEHDAD